jgi:hypothetical protein
MRVTLKLGVVLPVVLAALTTDPASAQIRRDRVAPPIGSTTEVERAPDRPQAPQTQPLARPRDRIGPAFRPEDIGPIGPIEPIGPQIDTGVRPPLDFTIPHYTTTDVSLRWWNGGGPQTEIHRSVSGGPWTLVQTYGPLPANAYVDFLDQSASIDAENCYMVTVSDGATTGRSTPVRCAMTRNGLERPVRRLQLQLAIATAAGADADDPVEVRLQSPSWLVPTVTNWRPAGNSTWLDSTADDFERGTNLTYELMLTNVEEMSDITQITVAKPGSDMMCVAGLVLTINSQPGYSRNYGNGANACVEVGGDKVLSVSFEELRTNPNWNLVGDLTIPGYSANELRAIIQAHFGHFLHGLGELRNGATLTTTYVNDRRLQVSVPVRVYDAPLLGDVDSNIRFDLALVGSPTAPRLAIENVDADSTDLLGIFLPVIGWKILYETSQTIESHMANLRPVALDSTPPGGTYVCFKSDASVSVCFGP